MTKLQGFLAHFWRAATTLTLLAGLGAGGAAAQTLSPTQLCRAAIATAELEASIPAGLLQAIDRVESGRADPATGEFGPWPWVLNAEGRGHFFPDRATAIAAVQAMQARGVRVIDVGCMQVNLHFHPQAFPNLEAAFDPLSNARYAARFLSELQSRSPDWLVAAGNYHSHTPHLSEAYRGRVQAAWPQAQARLAEDRALAGRRATAGTPTVVAPTVVALNNGVDRAQIIPVQGWPRQGRPLQGGMGASGMGRGLDAYRARPVPVTGRVPMALAAARPAPARPAPANSAPARPAPARPAPANSAPARPAPTSSAAASSAAASSAAASSAAAPLTAAARRLLWVRP